MADDIRGAGTSRPVVGATSYRDENTAYPDTRYAADDRWEREDRHLGMATTASGLNILAGVWLIIAPWVLNYGEQANAVWNQVTIGIVVAVLAIARVASPRKFEGLSWLNAVLGVWLLISPFVLVYGDTSEVETDRIYANNIILGLIIISLAIWSAMATKKAKEAAPEYREPAR